MSASAEIPPDYVEVTGEAFAVVAQAVATCARIRALYEADRAANVQMKHIAEGTRFRHGESPYYRSGFEWRRRIAFQLEQRSLTELGEFFTGCIAAHGASGVVATIIGAHITPSWSTQPWEPQLVLKGAEGTTQHLPLTHVFDSGVRFYRPPQTPDELPE